MEKQRTALPYPQIASRILKQGLKGILLICCCMWYGLISELVFGRLRIDKPFFSIHRS